MNYSLVKDYKINNDHINNNNNDSIILTLVTIIIGILCGVIIGHFIFRDIQYIGPDSNDIVKQIYKDDDGRHYKFKPRITICPMNYSMNKLHNKNYKESH